MDKKLFEQNIAVVSQRWPELASLLGAQPVETLNAFLVEGREGTVAINGIQLSSRHGRHAEAIFQADQLPHAPLLTIYGAGLGELPRVLLQRESLKWLDIKILNPAVFSLVLHVTEQQEWLADPRAELSLASADSDIRQPFFANPAELMLVDDASIKIMQRLQTEISDLFVSSHFDKDDSATVTRLESNRELISQDGDVGELFDTVQGRVACVLGAGPTLSSSLAQLKRMQYQGQNPLVIACDTACRVLLEHDIQPDYVVSMDRNISERHLPAEQLEHSTLVYFPMLAPEMIQRWSGARKTAYSASPVYSRLREELPKGILFSGGSVIHPALDLAVKMGCRDVILLGADFGYPGDCTHSGWQDGELGPRIETASSWTLNGYGDRIKSSPNFNSYLCEVERYIRGESGNVQFWNSSLDGAFIAGTRIHPEFER